MWIIILFPFVSFSSSNIFRHPWFRLFAIYRKAKLISNLILQSEARSSCEKPWPIFWFSIREPEILEIRLRFQFNFETKYSLADACIGYATLLIVVNSFHYPIKQLAITVNCRVNIAKCQLSAVNCQVIWLPPHCFMPTVSFCRVRCLI